MVGIHVQRFPPPLLPVGMFITVDISIIRFPGFVWAAPFHINHPSVALPDAPCALYLKIKAARTGQGGVMRQRKQYAAPRSVSSCVTTTSPNVIFTSEGPPKSRIRCRNPAGLEAKEVKDLKRSVRPMPAIRQRGARPCVG